MRIKKNKKDTTVWFKYLISVVIFICLMNPLSAQTAKINLSLRNVTLKEFLTEIEKKSEIRFSYIDETVDNKKNITIAVVNENVESILDRILPGVGLEYVRTGNTIAIKPKSQSDTRNQLKPVSGVITDEKGEPVIGASVIQKGTANGTVTDTDGRFTLDIPLNSVLQVSYLGYKTQEIPVGAKNDLNIKLTESYQSLDEVVVIGYGTVKKKDLTGSVGSVKSGDLMQRPATSVSQSLAGRMSGVSVSSNSGRPGGSQTIRIRGYSSIQATNEPLYIIDGVPGDLNSLNPNDIESVDVLKDASSTAIYGTRGSNGVIVITTKRGKSEPNVNYNTYLSVNKMARKLDVLNSEQFMYIEDQAYINAQKFDPTGFAQGKYANPKVKRMDYLIGNKKGNRELFKLDDSGNPVPIYDIDWQDMTTRVSFSQIHNLSWTGGSGNSNYGVYLGYINDQGIIKESNLKRYSGRITVDQTMSTWLKLGATLYYAQTNERRVDTRVGYNNVPRMMVEMVPFIPYKYADGTYGRRENYGGMEAADTPLSQIYENITPYNSNVFMGNAYAKITFIRGLDFTTTVGTNRIMNQNPYFNSTKSDIVGGIGYNEAQIDNNQSTQLLWSNLLNYVKTFNSIHSLNAMIGIEAQKYSYFQNVATIDQLSDDYYQWYNMGAGSILKAPSSTYNADQMLSYFARLNYSLKDRYLLTVTGRFDGSSKFGSNNKFAFFPSAAFGWRVKEEDFLKDNTVISNLKPRISYGFTGNSGIPTYGSMANLTTGSMAYPFGGVRNNGIGVGSLANPLLRWEKTGQFNVGFDIGFLNERISLTADYYIKNTKDMLLGAPVPSTSGFTSMTRNIGNMKNTGTDITINSLNIKSGNFLWSTTLTFSYLKNKITALGVNNADIIMGPNNLTILRVGQSVNSFFGYIRDGVWGTDEADQAAKYGKKPGDSKIRDIDNNSVINESDRIILGKGIPDFYGTFGNTFKYKNFDLLIELQYSYGNKIYFDGLGTCLMRQGIANSLSKALTAWTPENQNSSLEQWRPSSAGYNSLKDTERLMDGSFIRGKNISLGYTLSDALCKKIKLKGLRLTLSGQNVFLITKYYGFDPETTVYNTASQAEAFSQGIVTFDYPKPRTFTFGANITF